jgi:hypothetical protein
MINNLVSSIRQSSRGKGKGITWQVELNLPGVNGMADAYTYAFCATREIVDTIRRRWSRGARVDGSPAVYNHDTTLRRAAERYVLVARPNWKKYQQYIRTEVDPVAVTQGKHKKRALNRKAGEQGPVMPWYAQLAGRQRRILRVSKAKWSSYVRNIRRKYTARAGDFGGAGDIKSDRTSRRRYPHDTKVALNASGILVDSLHGKPRRGRQWTAADGRKMSVGAHVHLRVAKSRQRTAAWVGGLTQYRVDRVPSPQTQDIAERSIWWDADTVASAARAARLTWAILRLIGRL